MKRKYLFTLLAFILTACNKYIQFEDYYVAFDTESSSSTLINELGELQGAYYVHYCGPLRSGTFEVRYSIIPGDGLQEGIDYNVITGGDKLSFLPGIYNIPIRISWLPNEIDEGKDNSLRIRLDSCTDSDICIGYPGPDKKGTEVIIRKYKN